MKELLVGLKFREAIIADSSTESAEISRWKNSVAMHVRRGDFVGSIHDICGVEYYLNAINLLLKKIGTTDGVKFFIFSNGFDYVRDAILPLIPSGIPFQLMQGNDNDHMSGDFFLMSQCQHNIIPNSGFSMYPPLLNPKKNKIVIHPTEVVKGVPLGLYPGFIAIPAK